MPKRSAGLLIYRDRGEGPEVLLVHPGGPFFARKDEAAWSIPKGLVDDREDELIAARRETEEETGLLPDGPFRFLGEYKQPGGKTVVAWSVCVGTDLNPLIKPSNMFTIEWPPKSGRFQEFPEVDRVEWFTVEQAFIRMLKGQRPILDAFQA
ncbi:NUDIX domain-containing protein [Oryzifoliimicrobium ureilyticus]|uniref:NUDIX domain-containing protein n=1 Tax=Oryzifoliimicrobium ureilyticus TaxID=3113724 RepID=UPI0030762075